MIKSFIQNKHPLSILNNILEYQQAEQLQHQGNLQDSYQLYLRVHQMVKQFDKDADIALNIKLAKLSHLINQTDNTNVRLNSSQYLRNILDSKTQPMLQDYHNYCAELIQTDVGQMLHYLDNVDIQQPTIQQHLQLLQADGLVCNRQFEEADKKYQMLLDNDEQYIRAVSYNNSIVRVFFEPIDRQMIDKNIHKLHRSISLIDEVDIEQLEAITNNDDTQLSLSSDISKQTFVNLVRYLFIINHSSFNLHVKQCLQMMDDKWISKVLTLMAVKCASQQQFIKAEGLFRKSLENQSKQLCYDRLFCMQQYAYMLKQLDRHTEAKNQNAQIEEIERQLPTYSQQLECLVIPSIRL